MKKILGSVLTLGIVATVAVFATNAYFSDEETSYDNTFEAGSLDLKVSSTCHYYQDSNGDGIAEEVGCGNYGNWTANDLTNQVFFNFTDLKPGDYGENTIDFYVDDNPSWMCADITITEQSENGVVEPEGDDTEPGELANYLEIAWWKDDGDNIFEPGETLLYNGPRTLAEWLNIKGNNTLSLTFADSLHNWTGISGPIPGGIDNTQYLGIAWCFGEMTINGYSFICDGSANMNDSQTDKVVGNITFEAVQHRNNSNFICPERQQ